MDSPNPELMHLYGTDAYYLEKTGQMPGLVRALAGAAGFGLYVKDKKHQEELIEEAEAMNQQLRMVESAKTEGLIAGFEGRKAPVQSQPLPPLGLGKVGSALDPEAEKVASAFGRGLAQGLYKQAQAQDDEETLELLEKMASGVELTEMEKQAIFGKLLGFGAKALTKGKSLAGKGLANVSEGVANKAGKVVDWGGKRGAGGIRRGIGNVALGTENVALKAQKAGLKTVQKNTPPPPVVGKTQQATQTIQKGTPSNYRTGPGRTEATKQQTVGSTKTEAQNVRRQQEPAPKKSQPKATPEAQAQGAAPQAPQAAQPMPGTAEVAAKKKKPDPWLSWRSKALIGATMAGTGYLGYKGLQTARDVMLQPVMTGGAYNRYGGPVQHSTNQYGYVSPY